MEISQVVGTLYCTQRVAGLEHCPLRILRDSKGKLLVATDPVGTSSGNWVFTVSGSVILAAAHLWNGLLSRRHRCLSVCD